jgi:Skp family chaperone for outer membrane proteins|tara:strand:+ start:3429 stop:4052 length:624 start_codon:yes stop_codon:yes gene_type:complete
MAGKISLALNILLGIAVIYLFIKISTPEEILTEQETASKELTAQNEYPSIAIVDNDSLSLNYKFRIDKSKILEKASADVQVLENKIAKAQEDYYEIMNKSQTGGFTSDAEIAAAEKKVMKLQEDVPYLQSQMESRIKRLTKLEIEINDSLYSRLYRYIDSYTADKPIDVIMLYTKGMTGLYNNGSLDVTAEIVTGLNAAYESEKTAE